MNKPSTGDSVTQALVEFAERMKAKKLSKIQQDALILRIMDSLGCAALASLSPDIKQISGAIDQLGGNPQCTVLLRGKTALDHAGYLNSLMIRYLDLNDIYISQTGSHPSDAIGGILSAGELANKSGAEVLQAMAAAYHIMLDMSDAMNLATNGWDHSNISGVATAIAAGMLFDLSPSQMAHAISLCVVSSNILIGRSGKLSMWKNMAGPTSVRHGLFAAVLAKAAVTGPNPVFEGDTGFIRRVSGPFDLELNSDRDRTNDSFLKRYAATFHIQGGIEICLKLRERISQALGTDDMHKAVESIDMSVYQRAKRWAADTPDKWHPQNHETADHSLPFMSALALYFGKCDHHSIDKALKTPQVMELTQRIKVEPDAEFENLYPKYLPLRLVVKAGGREFMEEIKAPLGHITRPMPRDVALSKFQENATEVLGKKRTEDWAAKLLGFAELNNVREILSP